VDYVQKVVAIWDDLVDFLTAADPRLAAQGERPASFIQAGAWDDPQGYGGTRASLSGDGQRRLAPPGLMLDGEILTRDLHDVHDGVREQVSRSFFDEGAGTTGGDLHPEHPRNRRTISHPQAIDIDGAYSWATAARWQGVDGRSHVVETGALGRLWLTATRTDFPANDFIQPTGTGIRILIPANFLPEAVVEWRIPDRVNALERLRADAYGLAFAGLSAAISLLRGFELSRGGDTRLSRDWSVLDGDREGVGMWESGRGFNGQWVQTTDRRVSNFQVVGPSTWNASPRDDDGRPGPLEEALIGTPILEKVGPNGRLRGLDAVRVTHSFDPCMNCGSH